VGRISTWGRGAGHLWTVKAARGVQLRRHWVCLFAHAGQHRLEPAQTGRKKVPCPGKDLQLAVLRADFDRGFAVRAFGRAGRGVVVAWPWTAC
jgi:hypothetical protein